MNTFLGERIRQRREQLKMNQSDLAAKIGVQPSAIGNYENKVSNPKIELIPKIMEALGVDANYLFGVVVPEKQKSLPAVFQTRSDLVEKISALSDKELDDLDFFLDFVEFRRSKGSG